MTRGITTILFDMDNTLFDLVGAQIAACTAVADRFAVADGLTLYGQYFRSGRFGYESHENIRQFLADNGILQEETYSAGCRIYEEVKLAHVTPYPVVEETLAALREDGYNLAVITDAHSRDATRRLEKTALLPYFLGLVSYDMVRVKKPAPEPFLTALSMMQAAEDETVVVGDSPGRDIRPARDLGMHTVYARYGDRFSEVPGCPEAEYSISSMDELLPIVRMLDAETSCNRD